MASSSSARDCYGILGVGRDVGPDALRTAYRRACLRTHPDKPGGCAVRFREVVAAYETLSEPGLRAAADAGGWSADDALRRQQARAASSAAEAAKQAELLRRAEELARSAQARHCKMQCTRTHARAPYACEAPDSRVHCNMACMRMHAQAWAGVAANLADLAADLAADHAVGASACHGLGLESLALILTLTPTPTLTLTLTLTRWAPPPSPPPPRRRQDQPHTPPHTPPPPVERPRTSHSNRCCWRSR